MRTQIITPNDCGLNETKLKITFFTRRFRNSEKQRVSELVRNRAYYRSIDRGCLIDRAIRDGLYEPAAATGGAAALTRLVAACAVAPAIVKVLDFVAHLRHLLRLAFARLSQDKIFSNVYAFNV